MVRNCCAYRDNRLRKYWASIWNKIDWAYHFIFIAAVVLRLYAISAIDADEAGSSCEHEGLADILQDMYANRCLAQDYTVYAIRTLSMNCILLWVRLMNVLTIFPVLGPYIRMLSRMCFKVSVFLVLLFMVIIGFAGTFHVWFWNVEASEDISYDIKASAEALGSALGTDLSDQSENFTFDSNDVSGIGFASLEQSVMTLFSAAMGNFAFDELRASQPFFGPFLLAAYLFIALVMLLNLLIAILSDVYAEVQTKALCEINFAKTKVLADHRIFWVRRSVCRTDQCVA